MRFSQTLPALAAVASLSTSVSAFDEESISKGFTIHQELAAEKVLRNPLAEVKRAWLRYNGTVPKEIELAAAAGEQGSVTNNPERFDLLYLTPVQIGTPAQRVMLNIDTGSSDLWVFSNQLPARETKGHDLYSPSKSKTSKKQNGQKWSIKYGDGSFARGDVYTDKVSVGGVAVQKQAVETAQDISKSFVRDKNSDGIFGFAFSSINTVRPRPQKTWLANVGPRLNKNVFCANLNKGKPGSYDIGFINSKAYKGQIHYAPVNKAANGFWQFRSSAYFVGNKRFEGDFSTAIADTGTTLLFVPKSAAANYYRQVRSAQFNRRLGIFIYFCSDKLPSFSMVIGGSKRTVPGNLVNYMPIGTSGGRKVCAGGIQPSPQQGLTIVGDIFFKAQYVVFDQGNTRIGFADKA